MNTLGTIMERYKDAVLEVGLGRGYGHTGNATQDCVRLHYAALEKLLGKAVMGPLSKAMHLNGYGLGSTDNVKALVTAGLAQSVPDLLGPGVYYCQGWKGRRGHCFVVIVYFGPVPDPVWILEATNSSGDADGDGVPDKHDWYRALDWVAQKNKYDTLAVARLLNAVA